MADLEIAINSITINVVCECGNSLVAEVNRYNDEITVEACENCLSKEYDRGYKDGEREATNE